jgi:hypothetical protein
MFQIASYRGKSGISIGIEVVTYSIYSHTAMLFCNDMVVEVNGMLHDIAAGSVIEAWKGGVQHANSLSENHTPGTKVDLFSFKTPLSEEVEHRIASFLFAQIDKPYDYINVGRFVPIVRVLIPKPAPTIWTRKHVFCSELIMEGCNAGGVYLLERCKPWEVPPRDPPRSPMLYLDRTIVTKRRSPCTQGLGCSEAVI